MIEKRLGCGSDIIDMAASTDHKFLLPRSSVCLCKPVDIAHYRILIKIDADSILLRQKDSRYVAGIEHLRR